MLDKNKLLQDLIKLRDDDKKKIEEKEIESLEEMYHIQGSIINLETIIEFIEEGKYDKK